MFRILVERSADALDDIARQERRLAGLAIPYEDLTDEFATKVFTTLDFAPDVSFWDWARQEIRFAAQSRLVPLIPSGNAPASTSSEAEAFYTLGLLDRQVLILSVMEDASAYAIAEWLGLGLPETERLIESAERALEARLTGTTDEWSDRAADLIEELILALSLDVPGMSAKCEGSRRPRPRRAIIDDIASAMSGEPELAGLLEGLDANRSPVDAIEHLAMRHRDLGGPALRREILLANMYLTVRRPDDAKRTLDALGPCYENTVTRRAWARTMLRCLVILTRFEEAQSLLDSLPSEDDDHALLQFYRAGVHAMCGRHRAYRRATDAFQDCSDAQASFVRRTVVNAAPILAPHIGSPPAQVVEHFGVLGVPPETF